MMVSGGGGGIEPPNKGFAEPSYTIDYNGPIKLDQKSGGA